MPSSRKVRLTPDAEDDLRDLLQYRLETWGKRQRDTYRSLVRDAVRKLARFPGLGRNRDEILPGLRSYPIGAHVVFYSVALPQDGIIVHRILHGNRSVEGEFGASSS